MCRVITVVVPLTVRKSILGVDASVYQRDKCLEIVGGRKICPRHQGGGQASLRLMGGQRSNRVASPVVANPNRWLATKTVVKFRQIIDDLLH